MAEQEQSVSVPSTLDVFLPHITLGRCSLFEPYVFKQSDDDKNKGKVPSKPSYMFRAILDKRRDGAIIKKISGYQNAYIKELKAKRMFDKRAAIHFALVDCDSEEVEDKDTGELVIMSERDSSLRGKYMLSAKSRATEPPSVGWVDDKNILHPMPKHFIVNEEDPDSVEEYERRLDFWKDKVYAGQYASAVLRLSGWHQAKIGQGVTGRIKSVVIIGGGTPAGIMSLEDAFTEEQIAEMVAWRDQMVPDYESGDDPWNKRVKLRSGSDVDDYAEDDDVEEEEAPKPRRKVKPVKPVKPEPEEEDDYEYEEEAPKPRRKTKTARKTKPVEPEEDYEVEEDEEETAPAPRPRKSRKPVEPEPEADYDSDFDDGADTEW